MWRQNSHRTLTNAMPPLGSFRGPPKKIVLTSNHFVTHAHYESWESVHFVTLVTCPPLVFGMSLKERVRQSADRVRLDDLGVLVPDGPRVVLVLLICARTLTDLKRTMML